MRIFFIILLLTTICKVLVAQDWAELSMYYSNGVFVKASSELPDPNRTDTWINERYGVLNLVDGNYATAWVEGVEGIGVGEVVYISASEKSNTLNIHAGFGKTSDLYQKNSRVKKLALTYFIGVNPSGFVTEIATVFFAKPVSEQFFIELKDVDSLQTFALPLNSNQLLSLKDEVKRKYLAQFDEPIYQLAVILKLEIVEVYKGTKYNDTCISEIFFNDTFIADYRSQKFDTIADVYADENNESQLLFELTNGKTAIAISDPESVFQVVAISSCKRWAVVIKMPSGVGEGRVETEYMLLNTHLNRFMNGDIEKACNLSLAGQSFFFLEKDGEVFLEHANGLLRLK
ncbi:MAG TPA: hypothetical protein ENN24_06480 [Bacteroidetes bacterium]|nr:hypothetical protein [Bacteroidota bacterium]